MAIHIPANINKPVQDGVRPANGRNFSLQELYRYTGGDTIALIYPSDGRIMVIDDNAKLADKPEKNVRATEFLVFPSGRELREQLESMRQEWGTVIFVGDLPEDEDTSADYIAGDVLICESSEVE